MQPQFWKVSHGASFFSQQDVLDALNDRLVYVHKDTKAKGQSEKTQGEDFIEAPIGDYFYLTHGNKGIYALGQFLGPANIFCAWGDGWLDRPYRHIRSSVSLALYRGHSAWWAPSENSTFIAVPEKDLTVFEKNILMPYFDISLSHFGIE